MLCSGDVGIGLNARRLRQSFTNRFNITYSLRPVGELGTVYRRYPEQWKVFVEEPELPGRWVKGGSTERVHGYMHAY